MEAAQRCVRVIGRCPESQPSAASNVLDIDDLNAAEEGALLAGAELAEHQPGGLRFRLGPVRCHGRGRDGS
ncbi:hypothetical protein GCM10009735_69600 [Actinomadura chokoriensis]